MVHLKEVLIVGSLTIAVGGVASLAGGASGALVGGTTAAVLGVSLVTQTQKNKIAQLETEINKQQDWEKIIAKLPSLKVELQRRQEELQRLEKEKKAAELELLRATYDGLFRERETFKIRGNW